MPRTTQAASLWRDRGAFHSRLPIGVVMRISSRSFVLSLMAVACSGALACSSDIGKAKSALSSSDEDKSADVASDAGDAAEKSDDDAGAVTTDETNADKAAEDADSDSDDDAD